MTNPRALGLALTVSALRAGALATCLAASAIASAAPQPAGVWQSCHETRGFHDGDTFACGLSDAVTSVVETVVVRVAGLDAPESGQAYWRPARDRLRALVGPGVAVNCYKVDRYGRAVCRVRTADGLDAVEALLREGWAWHSTTYVSEQTPSEKVQYAAAERAAREARVGLWREPSPQAPWECRKAKVRRQRCR